MTERNEAQVLIDAYNALEVLAAQVLAGKQAARRRARHSDAEESCFDSWGDSQLSASQPGSDCDDSFGFGDVGGLDF